MALVLATDIEDNDGENGTVRIVAERGDSLPVSLKENRDQYIVEGILVDESMLPENRDVVITTYSQIQALAQRGMLTDEDLEALEEQEEIGTPRPSASHTQSYADRRAIVSQVSKATAASSRVSAPPAAGAPSPTPKTEQKAPEQKPAQHQTKK